MVISTITVLTVSNATTTKQEKSILYSRIVMLLLSITNILLCIDLYIKPLEGGIGLYGGLFNISLFSHSFNILVLSIAAAIMILTGLYPRNILFIYNKGLQIKETFLKVWNTVTKFILNTKSNQFNIIEYALIIVFILCGALLLMSTGDLISMFLSIELQSYGLYILSTLYRDSESATRSGLTYFLLGGLSSCFILFGSAILYINSGTTMLDNVYIVNSIAEFSDIYIYWYQPYYIHYSMIIVGVGLLFKVSAAPFHFWSPDVYDGIPTIVTTFVAIIAKISIFALMLELVLYTDYENLYTYLLYDNLDVAGIDWKNIILFSSLMSLIVGSILGLTQYRIKRLLAYSTISHVGFILLSLSVKKVESIQAYIFYIIQYSISNLNSFFILITIGFTLYMYTYNMKLLGEEKGNINSNNNKLIDAENSPIQLVNQVKGYFYVNSYLSISLAITLFSFVGIPPLIGFFAKQMVLSAALDQGYIFMVLVGIITSVIGAAYYLNLIKLIFFDNSGYIKDGFNNYITKKLSEFNKENNFSSATNLVTVNGGLSIVISLLTLLILLFIWVPGEWLRVVSILSLTLFKIFEV